MKKILIIGLISLISFSTLNASNDRSNDISNQQRIDNFVDKIVEEKDENLINQAKFDKEYLAYLRSKEASKLRKRDGNAQQPSQPISGIQSFNMSR